MYNVNQLPGLEGYADFLLTHIKPWARPASGGRVINCRCPYCGDSSNPNKGHMYISIPQNENEPSLYYCHRANCGAKGVVTGRKLIEWDIFDADIASKLTAYNKKTLSLPQNLKYVDKSFYSVRYFKITHSALTAYKLKYINDRLGTNLTYDDCIRLKIVLNLMDILAQNPKLNWTRHPNIINQLDASFIGFLSFDNSFVNMRKLDLENYPVHGSIDKKYINYNLADQYDNTCRFYTIPVELNMLSSDPIQIHVAEGVFDILSIYFNLYGGDIIDYKRAVFTSVGGSGYLGVIKTFIKLIKFPNCIINIYPDNDIDRSEMIKIRDILKPFNYKILVHRNIYPGEKDFGVPKNRIQESIEVL